MPTVYHRILQSFPRGYCLAFAYGSGVFKQLGYNSVKGNMMDFILAVNDPLEWHQNNMDQNPHHYSFLRKGGPPFICNVQEKWGAKIYFNTLVQTHEGLIKYGVISRSDLITDLLDWETLYIAGRLHKPVQMLHRDEADTEMKSALNLNLYSAIHSALLILPESFSENQLYMTLAGLSYTGDFRMSVGEDKNKVRNIVHAQTQEFRDLYSPILNDLQEYVILDSVTGMGEQDISPSTRLFHLSMLPMKVQLLMADEWNKDGRNRDMEDVLRAAANDPDGADAVVKGITDIVQDSSTSQAVKGILTAGFVKTLRYSWAKVLKMWKSLRK